MPNGSDSSSYDLFLSYNSADHALVEEIARKIRDEHLEPFLDRWYLLPGARWRPRLEQILGSCKAVAVFVGPGEMGRWQQRELDVALDLQANCPSFPVIPVLLPGCEPPLGFLRQLTWVDLRNQALDQVIVILAKAARGEPPGPDLERAFDSIRALEFVLKELWDNRHGGILLNETYDAKGGLQGAVAAKADELFKRLSSAEQKLLQRIFLRIVRPSAESTLDTRRRAAFTELPPEGKELVGKLTDERLLVTNQSASGLEQTVEVAYEALISNWSTLRAWVNEDREFLLWRDRLGPLLKEWERAQQTDEAVLRGPLLIEAQKWFDERSQDLPDQERKFISASREQRERLAREEKERQQCKLAEAEERRQEQAAAAKSLRRLAGVLVVVAIIAVGGAIFGFWQKNEAEIRKRAAEVANAEAKRQEAIAKENANKEKISRNAAEEQARIAEPE